MQPTLCEIILARPEACPEKRLCLVSVAVQGLYFAMVVYQILSRPEGLFGEFKRYGSLKMKGAQNKDSVEEETCDELRGRVWEKTSRALRSLKRVVHRQASGNRNFTKEAEI